MNIIDNDLKPVIIRIEDLNIQFVSNQIIFPKWQREDKWPIKFKQDLIISILNKRMIPMIFFGVIDDKTYILDGGHRTRAINSFINNEFSINLSRNGEYMPVYYNKKDKHVLNEKELNIFNNYPLPLYKYNNITEDESRDIFNDLQHFRSMTNAEICNSYASYLIDYLRNLKDFNINNNKSIYEILELSNNSYPLPKCHNYLLILIQLFSFFDGETSIKSLKDCKGGVDCVNYIKTFKQDDLTEEYKSDFEKTIKIFFEFIYNLPSKNRFKQTTLYSIYHYIRWHEITNYNEFFSNLFSKLLNNLDEYDNLKKNIELLRKKGDEQQADMMRESLKSYDNNIIEWFNTTIMRGNTYSNGREIRYNILKKLFNYNEIILEIDDVTEEMEQVSRVK
jgi:hypothetical protein